MNIFGSNKLWCHADRVLAYRDGKIPPPVTMELDLTDRCNQACPQCIGGRNGRELTLEGAQHVLSEMAEFGVRGVIFTGGGEPLMHPGCESLCLFARECGLHVGLITNGTCVQESCAAALVVACDWIRISLDAGDSAMYQQVHGVNMFRAAIDGIGALVSAKKEQNADCTIGVGYLTSAYTKRGMLSATNYAAWSGADYIQFRPYHYDETDILDVLPLCRQRETETFRVLASEQKYRHFHRWRRTYKTCHGARLVGVVQADGTMPICCHYRDVLGMEFGNVFERTLAELWDSEEKCEVLSRIDVQKCVPFCRADHINRLVQDVLDPKTHAEFL